MCCFLVCFYSVSLICIVFFVFFFFFFFSSRRRHTRLTCDWSSDVCSSDLPSWMSGAFEFGGITITYNRLWIIVFTMMVFVAQIGRASCKGKSVDLGGRRIIKKKK